MGNYLRLWGLGLVAAAGLAGSAQAAPVLITGGLFFPTNPYFSPTTNYFDPANGFVPAGAGNASSTTVPVMPASEFAYYDKANAEGADFTNKSLTIADFTIDGAYPFAMTFTASDPHFFDGAVLAPNSFGGAISVSGNTLTFTSPNLITTQGVFRTATISFLGTPEPAAWAMMIVGFGLVGAAMRRSRKVTTRVAYAF